MKQFIAILKISFKKIKSYDFNRGSFLYIILPVVLNLIITCLELKSVFKGIGFLFHSPYIFLANTLLILLTLSISTLAKRRLFYAGLISFFWLLLGVTNFVLLCKRITPFTACDLSMIDAAIEMIPLYFGPIQLVLLALLIVLLIAGLVFLYIKAPKISHPIKYGKSLLFIALACVTTIGAIKFGTGFGIMDTQFKELSAAYRKNGFAYCFINSLLDTGINKPKDYSEETISQIIDGQKPSLHDVTAQKTPNIIIVQLESFFDLTALEGLTLSDDVIPNFRKYQEMAGGLFTVPVIGAGTSNTEFEVVTGMNIDDFGAGEYPYKTILLDTSCESIAYNLKPYGYKTHVMHNHTGGFYGRNQVYANLGFENFHSVEYMHDVEETPTGWAKDEILTDYILEYLNASDEQDLIYTISVQGHGKYSVKSDYPKHVRILDCPPEKENLIAEYEYYANLLYEMDLFVEELVSVLSDFNEDTILVMYGDHLPSLEIETEDLDGRTMYQTDYFIWNNMGMDLQFGDIRANELSALLLQELGMTNGVINFLHQNKRGEKDFEELLAALSYDILYGDRLVYDGQNPYETTNIKMGLYDIFVENVLLDPTSLNTYLVTGQHFTPYSKVYVNGKKADTTFLDRNTLLFTMDKDSLLQSGDIINVWQSDLSCTEDFAYILDFDQSPNNDSSENHE